MRNLMLTYPRIEDPQPIAGGATSNQLPRNQLEAGAARAGVVADNVDNLVVEHLIINWPEDDAEVPVDWRNPERIENGTERIQRYDYRQAKHAEFHALWARHIDGLHLDNPFAGASSPELETYAIASES